MKTKFELIDYHNFKELLEEFVTEHCIILDGTNPYSYVSIGGDFDVKELYSSFIKNDLIKNKSIEQEDIKEELEDIEASEEKERGI